MLFDHALTFGSEVNLFWRGRRTGASLIFLLNRYLALANFIIAMCEYAPHTQLVIIFSLNPLVRRKKHVLTSLRTELQTRDPGTVGRGLRAIPPMGRYILPPSLPRDAVADEPRADTYSVLRPTRVRALRAERAPRFPCVCARNRAFIY